ncbi:flagellar basal-body MS-ring/collar protein FliF [Marinilactibacillus piezotolerans]|uniref:flagellar basal-body MS-ring/collar protein FliF n=1 Tax=Marinilactibacillus piezotolerans TaxID=258723 RepID=UPI0009B03E9D|nr:flagellar basal-body MS-ring/collar protein FliF [Marinilactibacillus piezotolerans]
MDKVKELWNNLRNGWINLDSKKRTRLISVVVVAAVLLGVLAYITQQIRYTVLFSELDEADAGAIVENLETDGVDYRLEDGGTKILIDDTKVDEYRLQLATNGLMPESSTGFEIFDETSMMATDEDREIMYQRAVTGELERSISSLKQIDSAKVMLSLPEESVFQNPEYSSEASASIVVDATGAGQLTTQNIQGIAALVSGAVDKLPIENIQIVDANGNLLSGFLQSGESAMGATDISNQQLSVQNSYEKEMEESILTLLGPVYGRNNLRVAVNARMNFDAVEGETVEYTAPMTEEGEEVEDPQGLIRSQTESYNGSGDAVQGLIEQGELPVAEEAEAEDGNNTSADRTTNYELDSKTERYVEAPGKVEAINASIIVNQNAEVVPSEEQIVEISRRVLGLDDPGNEELVGDVAFQAMPFAEGNEIDPIGSNLMDDLMIFFNRYWPYMVGSIVLLVTLIIVLGIFRRGRKDNLDEFDQAFEPVNSVPQESVELTPIEPDPVDMNQERKKQKMKVMSEKEDLVREEAKQNPELAAELMKIWMKE